ncbi:hypothetical protein AC249_AIPGENE274 [Exaiptasia diaphana]|nr:hypothetical protein AC249_AIPGENE274 [Exaiptasia diaphana]
MPLFLVFMPIRLELNEYAEYDDKAIGLQVATISENRHSFVTQALRIHPEYRGKRLSYLLTDAVTASVRSKFPQISRKNNVCKKKGASFAVCIKKGSTPIMKQKVHEIQKIPTDVLRGKRSELCNSGLVSLDTEHALELYKSKKLLDLIGSHGFIVVDKGFPHKLPEDSHLVINEVDQVYIDVSLQDFQQGQFPKSFSQGVMSKRVAKEFWICQIYTNDARLFKKHFLRQLSAAVQCAEAQEFIFRLFLSGSSKLDGSKLVKDELCNLKLNCEMSSDVRVLLEYVFY